MIIQGKQVVWYFDEIFQDFKYPAGEPHVRLNADSNIVQSIYKFQFSNNDNVIIAEAKDFNDLSIIVLADQILKLQDLKFRWVIPYFPFARHDRRNDMYDSTPLHLAMNMVADINLTIIDPHSEVSAYIKHIPQSWVVRCYEKAGLFDNNPVVIIPDAGAAKKTFSWLKERDYVQALKKRDGKTGKLSGFQILAEPEQLHHRNVVIIDDICDAGGTFLGLAYELREYYPIQNISLAVTHGLFTKGLDTLLDNYEYIYTLDTCILEHTELIKIPLEQILQGVTI